jgi:hypothetical protein
MTPGLYDSAAKTHPSTHSSLDQILRLVYHLTLLVLFLTTGKIPDAKRTSAD